MTMDIGNVLGMLGVLFCLASFAMKNMLSLRVLALAGNIFSSRTDTSSRL